MHPRDPTIAPLHRLMAFSQAVHVRRMIEGIAGNPKQTFWNLTMNLLLESATTEWCKVFGSRDDDTHWTQVVPKDEHDKVRAELLVVLGMAPDEWLTYRETIVSYRNQMVAHHDLTATVASYPEFDPGLKAADFMFAQLRAKADQDWLGDIPTSLNRWAIRVSGNMSAIVRAAFNGSAELGSNIPGN